MVSRICSRATSSQPSTALLLSPLHPAAACCSCSPPLVRHDETAYNTGGRRRERSRTMHEAAGAPADAAGSLSVPVQAARFGPELLTRPRLSGFDVVSGLEHFG